MDADGDKRYFKILNRRFKIILGEILTCINLWIFKLKVITLISLILKVGMFLYENVNIKLTVLGNYNAKCLIYVFFIIE